MSNEIISWLLVAEIALPLAILSVVLGGLLYRLNKKNKEAARNLILQIKNNEDNEKAQVLAFLTDKLGLDQEQAKAITKRIINERKFLFRNLISGLLDRNVEAIAALESDMSRISRHYHQLQPAALSASEAKPQVETEPTKEKELKQEIKELKHEIHITLTTLNNIFAEFSSMFGEEVPETELSVDKIITAMESFSGKNAQQGEGKSADPGITDELADDEPDAFAEVEVSSDPAAKKSEEQPTQPKDVEPEEAPENKETLDFSLDDELDDIDSALDELELGATSNDEPSWDEAFEESGDKPDEK